MSVVSLLLLQLVLEFLLQTLKIFSLIDKNDQLSSKQTNECY